MPAREVRFRSLAANDIDNALDHYRTESDNEIALGFIDALEHTIGQISRSPRAGSLEFSYEVGIPQLRARKLRRFPYVVFYLPHDDRIDVWRVLHSRRDIPAALTDDP